MATDAEQLAIDQITRVIQSMKWNVTSTDTTGPSIKITIEKAKPSS